MELCVALDLPTIEENLALAESLSGLPIWLKVGFRTFIRDGWPFLEDVKNIDTNFKLFLDLKLYDIPNTMADAVEEIANLGTVDMFNVHASSGKEAMQTVMQRLDSCTTRPLVLAVTALTSFDDVSFRDVYSAPLAQKATQFAINAYQAGLDGVVCSVKESKEIKTATSNKFITLTPGIRPAASSADDQKRIATPIEAKNSLVDIAVIGRPIYNAPSPKRACEEILRSF
jgi:orotidine-5'-phosphate decarboxylase